MNSSRRNLLKACCAVIPFLGAKKLFAESQVAKNNLFDPSRSFVMTSGTTDKVYCYAVFGDNLHPLYKNESGELIYVPFVLKEDGKKVIANKLQNLFDINKNIYITEHPDWISIVESEEKLTFVRLYDENDKKNRLDPQSFSIGDFEYDEKLIINR